MEPEAIREIIRLLNLQNLAGEGGLFAETYRSEEQISTAGLPAKYSGPRWMGSAIYYALSDNEDSFSALHCLETDEIYHFYLGDPVELLLLYQDGTTQKIVLGSDLLNGQSVQFVVPAHTWQGSRLLSNGNFALMGTTMAPGYDPADFTLGERADLTRRWPCEAALIKRLTRN